MSICSTLLKNMLNLTFLVYHILFKIASNLILLRAIKNNQLLIHYLFFLQTDSRLDHCIFINTKTNLNASILSLWF